MLLAIDVGNTNVDLGCFDARALTRVSRFPTEVDGASEAFRVSLCQASDGMPDAVIVSSVVGGMVARARTSVQELWEEAEVVEASPSLDLGIRSDNQPPESIGVDRLVAAGEAFRLAEGAAVVVGVGTALTVDGVSEDGRFVGGTISPGLRTSLRSLADHTSLLPEVSLSAPDTQPGGDTAASILRGVVFGMAGGVDRLVEELKASVGEGATVLLTGGDAAFLSPYVETRHRLEEHLVLRGLSWTYERYAGR